MKIKKIFGLATVASLAVVMTACGKNQKKESFVDNDVLNSYSISNEEAFNKSKSFTKYFAVFNNLKISDREKNIVLAYDENNYYVYNLGLDGDSKLVKTIAKDGIYNVDIDSGLIIVSYDDYDTNYNQSYEAYLFNGELFFEKALCARFNSSKQSTTSLATNIFDEISATEYKVSANIVKGDEFEQYSNAFYNVVKETESFDGKESKTYEYLTYNDFNNKYNKNEEAKFSGEIVGLKGYDVEMKGSKLILLKKNKIVNILSAEEILDGIISDGYLFFQTSKIVSVNDDYDFCLGGSYYKLTTFKMSLIDSKITEIKDFHYYIANKLGEPIMVKGKDSVVIRGYAVALIDFKGKKEIFTNDMKLAIVTGKGDVTIQSELTGSSDFINKDNSYYSYVTSADYYSTIEYDSKGNIKNIYDGLYINGYTIINEQGNTLIFKDKDQKQIFVLKSFVNIDYGRYYGEDLYHNPYVVEITKDGSFVATKLDGYNYNEALKLFYTTDSTTLTFYTSDTSLTSTGFSYDSTNTFSHYVTIDGTNYYTIKDSSNNYTLVYFE